MRGGGRGRGAPEPQRFVAALAAVRSFPGRRAGLRASALAVVLLCAAGCTSTIWTDVRFEQGERVMVEAPETLPEVGDDKAEVLSVLGPPGRVVALNSGDLFVYQLRSLDLDYVQVNSGLVVPVGVPIYGNYDGAWTDVRLYVAFDRQGLVRHVSTATSGGAQAELARQVLPEAEGQP